MVSSRPSSADAYVSAASKGSQKRKYFRADSSQGKTIAKSFPQTATDPLRFYRLEGNKITATISAESGKRLFVRSHKLESDGSTFPTLLVAMLFGAAVGLIFFVPASFLPGVLLAVSFISLYKLNHTCVTCPEMTLFGLNPALIGTALFASLAVLSWFSQSQPVLATVFTVTLATLAWQMMSWWRYKTGCLPCTFVSLGLGFILASVPRWFGENVQVRTPKVQALVVGSVLLPGLAINLIIDPAPESVAGAADASLYGYTSPTITSVTQLGIDEPKEPAAYLVAANGCEPCHKMLDYLDTLSYSNIVFYYTTESAPDKTRDWIPLPKEAVVPSTPTLIIYKDVESEPVVYDGFGYDPTLLQGIARDLQQMEENHEK